MLSAATSIVLRLAQLFGSFLGSSSHGDDPCALIAGKMFVPPQQALDCLQSFPLNETVKKNVMDVVSSVFDFYTFEDYYLDSPPPFGDSTKNIRAALATINNTRYSVSFSMFFIRLCRSECNCSGIMTSIELYGN